MTQTHKFKKESVLHQTPVPLQVGGFCVYGLMRQNQNANISV